MAKERMFSTSIQLSNSRLEMLDEIVRVENASSNAAVLRDAFDFYVKNKYPEIFAKNAV